MMVPMIKDDYKNKSLKELIEVRQLVMFNLMKIEKEYFCIHLEPSSTKKPFKATPIIHPSPDTQWTILNMDLKMLNELIDEHDVEEEIVKSYNDFYYGDYDEKFDEPNEDDMLDDDE